MTLFFNLQNLEKEAGNDTTKFIELLKFHYEKRLPRKKDKYLPRGSLAGANFILQPAPLFSKLNIDKAYIVQYIKIAGLRDYSLYKLYGVKTLPLSYFPDIDIEAIKHNPLLKITKTDITLKFE